MVAQNFAKRLILFIGLGALFCFTVGCSLETDQETKEVKAMTPVYNLSADALYSEYEANQVAADNKYKGKIIIVTGKVQDIGLDIMDQPYIVIGGKGFLDGVQCMFSPSENNTVARISKGQMVTVKGEVDGKIVGNVLLRKCSVVSQTRP